MLRQQSPLISSAAQRTEDQNRPLPPTQVCSENVQFVELVAAWRTDAEGTVRLKWRPLREAAAVAANHCRDSEPSWRVVVVCAVQIPHGG